MYYIICVSILHNIVLIWFYLTQITINCGYFATIIHKKVRDCSYLTTQSLPLYTIDPYKIYGLEVVEAYDFSYNYKLIEMNNLDRSNEVKMVVVLITTLSPYHHLINFHKH